MLEQGRLCVVIKWRRALRVESCFWKSISKDLSCPLFLPCMASRGCRLLLLCFVATPSPLYEFDSFGLNRDTSCLWEIRVLCIYVSIEEPLTVVGMASGHWWIALFSLGWYWVFQLCPFWSNNYFLNKKKKEIQKIKQLESIWIKQFMMLVVHLAFNDWVIFPALSSQFRNTSVTGSSSNENQTVANCRSSEKEPDRM